MLRRRMGVTVVREHGPGEIPVGEATRLRKTDRS